MASPDFVPVNPSDRVRTYTSPPRRNDAWVAGRPGDVEGAQPSGPRLGTTGPDQGYAFTLVDLFEDRLVLGSVDHEDAVAGCVAIAMRRSALFGRGPVVHDLTVAFTVFGFLDESPDPALVSLREGLFAEVKSSHHYTERRELVDLVLEEILRLPHAKVEAQYETDWRSNLA